MSAYEKAHAWRELFALASKQKVEGSELEDICDRVSGAFEWWCVAVRCLFRLAEYLSQHNRHLEAAQIVLDYQKNVEHAVHILCRGTQFGEAFRLVGPLCVWMVYMLTVLQIALHGKEELVEGEVYPGLEDAHEQLLDVFDEMEGQLDKEVSRVAELVVKMGEDPGKHIHCSNRIPH
jgi:elongator complex protein 1